MANTWVNASSGDLARYTLASFHNGLKFLKTIGRQFDADFRRRGSRNSGTLLIREPNEFIVRSGAVMDAQDITESTQTFTLATQRGVDVNTSTIDLSLSIEDFQKQILNPMMSRLAAEVESIVLSNVYKDVYNMTGTAGSAIASPLSIMNANARLTNGLAPDDDRYLLLDPSNMATAVNSVGAYFHKASELEKAFSKAVIGNAYNFTWMESAMIPSHTAGTRAGTAVCNTSTGITSGSANISVTDATATQTFLAGDIVTIGDVFACNRETKTRYSNLKQFAVTADATVADDGTVTLAVSPTPVTSGAKQNVVLVSAGASKTVTNTVNGAASSVILQPLAYYKDAFAFVMADMFTSPKEDMAVKNFDGISIRVWRKGDIVNDKFPLRIDVLFGYKTIRPEWAVRVQG